MKEIKANLGLIIFVGCIIILLYVFNSIFNSIMFGALVMIPICLTGSLRWFIQKRIKKDEKRKFNILSLALIFIICVPVIFSVIYYDKGYQHYKKGGGVFVYEPIIPEEMEKAANYFHRSTVVFPLNLSSFVYEGQSLNHIGHYEEAIKVFDRALAVYPFSFSCHYEKAYSLMKLERYNEMVNSLKKAQRVHHNLNSWVRFDEEFRHLKDKPFMKEFEVQFRN